MFTNNPIEDQIFLTFVAAESAKKKNQQTNFVHFICIR